MQKNEESKAIKNRNLYFQKTGVSVLLIILAYLNSRLKGFRYTSLGSFE